MFSRRKVLKETDIPFYQNWVRNIPRRRCSDILNLNGEPTCISHKTTWGRTCKYRQDLQRESVENIPDATREMMSLKLPLCQDLRAPWKPF